MRVEWFREYSNCLSRLMEYKVYGHAGKPILVFPAQNGRYYDYENFKMIESISNLIDEGKIQLFCCDSIDLESWSAIDKDPGHRIYMHEQWFYYIVNELVPRIFEINSYSNNGYHPDGIITTGCSLGATHAVNFMFRRPDIFNGAIGLSGYYDSDIFFGDYSSELVYNNSPIRYISNMDFNHPYIDMYKKSKIILCCGQGSWEDEMILSINKMKDILNHKNIPAWIDIWGKDVNHDWDWWRIQINYFLRHVI